MRMLTPLILLTLSHDSPVTLKLDARTKPAAVKISVEHRDVAISGRGEERKMLSRTEALAELEDSKGGPVLKLTLMRVIRTGPEGTTTDTDKDDGSLGSKALKGMLGVPLRLKPGAAKASEINGLKDLAAKLEKIVGGGDNARADAAAMIAGWILQDLSPFVLFHPEKPIAVGKSWSRDLPVTVEYPVRGQASWTLSSRRDGRLTVELKATLKSVTPPAPQDGKLVFVRELSGTLEGKIEVDEASGWPTKCALKRTLKGEHRVEGLKSKDPGDVDKVTVVSDYTIERVAN